MQRAARAGSGEDASVRSESALNFLSIDAGRATLVRRQLNLDEQSIGAQYAEGLTIEQLEEDLAYLAQRARTTTPGSLEHEVASANLENALHGAAHVRKEPSSVAAALYYCETHAAFEVDFEIS